jgi:hypothetical protein
MKIQTASDKAIAVFCGILSACRPQNMGERGKVATQKTAKGPVETPRSPDYKIIAALGGKGTD